MENNILISIEDKKIEITDLRKHFGKNTEFVYSYIHIQELLEAGTGFEALKDSNYSVTTLHRAMSRIISKGFWLFLIAVSIMERMVA